MFKSNFKTNHKNINQFAFHSKFSVKTKKLILSYFFKKQFEDQVKKFKKNSLLFYKSNPQIGFFYNYSNSQFKPYNDLSSVFFRKKKKKFIIKKKYIKNNKIPYSVKTENQYRKENKLKSKYFF
jgi:hypothetical protein